VTTNYLRVHGIRPALGRDFLPEEGLGGDRPNVIIVSHAFWVRHLRSDPGAVGKRLLGDGLVYTIVGVLPPDFFSALPVDLLAPWNDANLLGMNRTSHNMGVIGRLKPGVTREQASEDLNAIQRRIAETEPSVRNWGAAVVPMQEAFYAGVRTRLWLLLAAVGFVLLIACANLANLLLARAAARGRETAIRTALGAGRARLVRQYLTENLLLSLIGGGLGLILAVWGVDFLESAVPRSVRLGEAAADILRPAISIDPWVLGFTLLVSLVTGIVFGLAPAFAAARADVNEALKESGRHSASTAGQRIRNLLVVSEVALALVLLIAAGLSMKSFWLAQRVDPGFEPRNVLTVEMELPTDSKYPGRQAQSDVYRRFLERVEALPGVQAAGLTSILPMDQAKQDRVPFLIEGRPPLPEGQFLSAERRRVSPGYFAAVGIPLARGRGFTERDNQDNPRVAIIDESAARRYFPDGPDPVGQRIDLGRNAVCEIVGIVSEVRDDGLDQQPKPTIYLPYLQSINARMSLAVRTAHGNPSALIGAVKSAIWAVDKDQPVYNIRTMEEIVAGTGAPVRFTLAMLVLFAAVALGLASIGIYGVMSYTVSLRTGEIGIRMALGAQARDVLLMVVRQGMAMVGLGVAAGVLAALALTRLLASLLYGVGAADPAIYIGGALALSSVALLASWLPARRAAKVDPILSLRYQ
jgi:putative ABC transport system permease protein